MFPEYEEQHRHENIQETILTSLIKRQELREAHKRMNSFERVIGIQIANCIILAGGWDRGADGG